MQIIDNIAQMRAWNDGERRAGVRAVAGPVAVGGAEALRAHGLGQASDGGVPVVLQDDHIDIWLDPAISDPRALDELLKAPPENFLECYPVS